MSKFKVERICPFCGKLTTVEVESSDYVDYIDGRKFIQDAFPYLDASDREVIMTGTCKDCLSVEMSEETWIRLEEV